MTDTETPTEFMSHWLDLADDIAAICRKLELEPTHVAEITIRPADAEALVYLNNSKGKKYVDPETGAIAMGRLKFKVRT